MEELFIVAPWMYMSDHSGLRVCSLGSVLSTCKTMPVAKKQVAAFVEGNGFDDAKKYAGAYGYTIGHVNRETGEILYCSDSFAILSAGFISGNAEELLEMDHTRNLSDVILYLSQVMQRCPHYELPKDLAVTMETTYRWYGKNLLEDTPLVAYTFLGYARACNGVAYA